MAKDKTKPSEKKAKKTKKTESVPEAPETKKKKLKVSKSQDPSETPVSEDPDSTAPQDKAQDEPNLEDLTPEERRVLERKLKKQLKKEAKRLKREEPGAKEEKKEEPAKPSAGDLALQYLKSWSEKVSGWKFQKLRQTWLLMNMYDQEKVPDEYFSILLDYLGGLQGAARETTIKKAEAFMKEHDEREEEEEEDDSPRIDRIREVLQLLS